MLAQLFPLLILVSPASALSLDQAIEATLARAPSLQVSAGQIQEAKARVRTVSAPLLPTVTAIGGATWQNEITFSLADQIEEMDLPIDTSGITPAVITPGFQWTGSVQATQALLAPGAWMARQAAKAGESLATVEERSARYQISLLVAQAWHASARTHALVENAKHAVEVATRVESLAQTMVDNGVAARSDILPARQARATAMAGLAKAEASAIAADAVLARLTGRTEAADPVTPPESIPDAQSLIANLDRADLQAGAQRAEAARAVAKANWGPAIPYLGAQGSMAWMNPEPYFADPMNWKVSVGVTVPLVQGGAVAGRVDEAKAKVMQADAGLEAMRQVAEIEVLRIHGQLATAMAADQEQAQAVVLAREAVAASEIRLKEGSGSLLGLFQAQGSLVQAEIAQTQARADASLAADQLRLMAGLSGR